MSASDTLTIEAVTQRSAVSAVDDLVRRYVEDPSALRASHLIRLPVASERVVVLAARRGRKTIAAAYGSYSVEDAYIARADGQDADADAITRCWFMVHAIAVRPEARRSGIGSALLTQLEEAARAAGYTVMTLVLAADKPDLQAFYESAGYSVLGAGEALRLPLPDARTRILPFADSSSRWAKKNLRPQQTSSAECHRPSLTSWLRRVRATATRRDGA